MTDEQPAGTVTELPAKWSVYVGAGMVELVIELGAGFAVSLSCDQYHRTKVVLEGLGPADVDFHQHAQTPEAFLNLLTQILNAKPWLTWLPRFWLPPLDVLTGADDDNAA